MTMFGISRELKALFGHADVLVFVDDWRGSDSRDADAPIYFSGRSFLRSDYERVDDLRAMLVDADAGRWHASKRGAPSLFKHTASMAILEQVDLCRTTLYSDLSKVGDYGETIKEKWRHFLLDPEMRRVWSSEHPHALALFRYLDFLGHRLGRDVGGGGLSARIVVDRVDWLRTGPVDGGAVVPIGYGHSSIGIEVFSIWDKGAAAEELRFLGLVDSEAYAFGRLQTRLLPDGSTLRSRLLDWQRRGGSRDELVFTEDEYKTVAQALSEPLRRYVDRWFQWHLGGRVVELRSPEQE